MEEDMGMKTHLVSKIIEGSSVEDLCVIAEHLEELQTLCQARLRLKLPDERNPTVDDTTTKDASDLRIGCASDALQVARWLVSEVRRKLDKPIPVKFEGASLGCVRVVWEGCDMIWVVRPSELPWPGVSVRLYPSGGPRSVFTASEVTLATLGAVEKSSFA